MNLYWKFLLTLTGVAFLSASVCGDDVKPAKKGEPAKIKATAKEEAPGKKPVKEVGKGDAKQPDKVIKKQPDGQPVKKLPDGKVVAKQPDKVIKKQADGQPVKKQPGGKIIATQP
jgi:hypothetical protein